MCVNGECIEGNGEVDPCEDVDCPQGQICQDGGCFDEGDEFDPCEDVVCEQGQSVETVVAWMKGMSLIPVRMWSVRRANL